MNQLPFETIEREILVKRESTGNYGKRPEERSTKEIISFGIINIDKPSGPTSHQVSDFVKKILNISKAGHSGTLDPRVTGVLAVALGRATRISHALLPAGKEYITLMHLHKPIEKEDIEKVFKEFTGEIRQKPPIKSAVRRVERTRSIYYIDILEIDGQEVLFKVGCQAGTYIRKLCLHPKTEILSKNGPITASDFYLNHPTIYSFSKGKMIEKNPSATQKLHSPKKLIKITMSSGIDLIITPDHKLLVSKKEGYKMIEAQSLKTEDYLVKSLVFPEANKNLVIADLLDDYYLIAQENIKNECKKAFISKYGSIRAMHRELKLDRKTFLAKSKNTITLQHLKVAGIYEKVKRNINQFKTQKGTIIKIESLNEDFFYLLGLIASDGNNTKEKHTRIKFHNKNENLIDEFLKTYKKIFPKIPISKKKIKPSLFQLDTANSFLATIAASLGIKSPQKDSDLLPILNTKPNLIKAFIKGYFDGDGSVYYKETKKNCKTKICLHTISHLCATRLHKMLLKIKIPNKIFFKPKNKMYEVTIENIAVEQEFIQKIGSNHTKKLDKFKKILNLKCNSEIDDYYLIGLHHKREIKKNKSRLYKMGGNLSRVLNNQTPITKNFYKKASKLVKLPSLDDFIVEKIKSIKEIKGVDYVYDMTVPETHNFLIETGFVSSNCHDIGRKLGCGAHMAELRRTKVASFNESTLFTLQDLTDAFHYYKNENNDKFLRKIIQPMENAVNHLPKVWILDTTINTLSHGRDLAIPGISKLESKIKKDDLVAVMTLKNELIALGIANMTSEEIMQKNKGIAFKTDKVFMPS